ncbi:MAG: hypothetical protein ABL893_11815, partial [Hyphomicrobium sp.]
CLNRNNHNSLGRHCKPENQFSEVPILADDNSTLSRRKSENTVIVSGWTNLLHPNDIVASVPKIRDEVFGKAFVNKKSQRILLRR